MQKKLCTLKRLEISRKVPKGERKDTKSFLVDIKKMIKSEPVPALKSLHVPEFLLCPFSGDLMKEPVTLGSGRTFEKESIIKYFEVQREVAKRVLDQYDDEDEESEKLTEESFLICPVNLC